MGSHVIRRQHRTYRLKRKIIMEYDIDKYKETTKGALAAIDRLTEQLSAGHGVDEFITDIDCIIDYGKNNRDMLKSLIREEEDADTRTELKKVLKEWNGYIRQLTTAAHPKARAVYASAPVRGVAPVTVSLANGVDAAVYLYAQKDGEPPTERVLSDDAFNAIVYLLGLMPKDVTPVDSINNAAELTLMHSQIELSARELAAFVTYMHGSNTEYTRRELANTLAELSQPLITRVAYRKSKRRIVIDEIGNVRLIEVHPRRTFNVVIGGDNEENADEAATAAAPTAATAATAATAPKTPVVTDADKKRSAALVDYREGIIINIGRLFYLDAKHFTPTSVEEWGRLARGKNGTRFTRVARKLFKKGDAIYAVKKNGGTVRYLFSDEGDYSGMSSSNQARRRKGCRAVAADVAHIIGAVDYTADMDGITFRFDTLADECKEKRNCANRDSELCKS